MNAAIEAAARAVAVVSGENWDAKDFLETLSGNDPSDVREHSEQLARAAIIAFLRNCEVSEGVARNGGQEYAMTMQRPSIAEVNATAIFKAMAAQLATELEGK